MKPFTRLVFWSGVAACGLLANGGRAHDTERPTTPPRPSILWVTWDTVRADRTSAYGAPRRTTPKLERWAAEARRFADCTSVAATTLPAHASMFTGLLPLQHGTHQGQPWLDDGHRTLAEILRDAGYRTYLWSSNIRVSSQFNLQQGFETQVHPWDDSHREAALAIVRGKLEREHVPWLRTAVEDPEKWKDWAVKAAGTLAVPSLLEWLGSQPPGQPYFAFLNFMEAHAPYIPPERYRRRFLQPERVASSYAVERSLARWWKFSFRLAEYDGDELELLAATYDAALAELDDLFAELLAALGSRGLLDDTIVVLTSDHGEFLGEHHLLGHQQALYQPVLRVPLLVHYPSTVPPGVDSHPVMNFDLFPTLLELAGLSGEIAHRSPARSLLRPEPRRARLSVFAAPWHAQLARLRRMLPDWDPKPFDRSLRALQIGASKLIWSSNGQHELYDLDRDPQEANDLYPSRPEQARRMLADLEALVAGLGPARQTTDEIPPLSRETREMLEALGYLGNERRR